MSIRKTAAIGILIASASLAGSVSTAQAASSATTPPAITVLGPVVYYHHGPAGGATGIHSALPYPNSCPLDTWSQIDSSSYIFDWDGRTYFRDGPGGSMSVSVTQSSTLSATISASATISLDELVADASATVSASVTKTAQITVGHTYNHNISNGMYGNAEYGAWGYNVSWSQWRQNGNCTSTKLASGSGTVPTTAVGWNYWEN
jgi:hypothetical protein